MEPAEYTRGLRLLFENFWIIKKDMPAEYIFLKRHQKALEKEIWQRFGLYLVVRPQFIQLLRRPHTLASWMGLSEFTDKMDYVLFACAMGYIEEREPGTPFMLNELIQEIDHLLPENLFVDWTNYQHRKSLVRVLKKILDLKVIEDIQGTADEFETNVDSREVLYITTSQSRYFLGKSPASYRDYDTFSAFWKDVNQSKGIEKNQELYQRLMMEPVILRTKENEELFIRLRNYRKYFMDFADQQTIFQFELTKDMALFTTEQRDGMEEVFPSRKVIDELLIQLATIFQKKEKPVDEYGLVRLSRGEWLELVKESRKKYLNYWSKEFEEMSLELLAEKLLVRAEEWQYVIERNDSVVITPLFSRIAAVMEEN
ncbi:TIGR02678 family protein [Enterococcus sp. BWB1-3]|uniref:TIGR02678 family protein n=1 Tax=Enterococcus sp. BWB1-3 TaxID=2787713 RepID=UPI001924DE22|nr:TIGR02678 family protein [Enterococcus sp. BWB1-3]MBL1230249.1 TIGR02678 family protein [Enterococcus sp. BWB1-3]